MIRSLLPNVVVTDVAYHLDSANRDEVEEKEALVISHIEHEALRTVLSVDALLYFSYHE